MRLYCEAQQLFLNNYLKSKKLTMKVFGSEFKFNKRFANDGIALCEKHSQRQIKNTYLN